MAAMIDWLSVYQDYPEGGLPVVGEMIVERWDTDSGELVSRTVTGYQHAGSFDSSLRVRCDGSRVEVSGNPSRFNRPDNLFGLFTMDAAIAVYNRVLEGLGLPPFTASCNTHPRQLQGGAGGVIIDGARISRVDLCQLYSVGDNNERLFMRWAASRTLYGEPGKLYPDGYTVTWHEGSRRVMVKYYAKGPELLRGVLRRDEGREYWDISDGGYRARLAAWCLQRGIVRHEITLRGKQLAREGLNTLNGWTVQAMGELMQKWNVGKKVDAGIGSYSETAEALMAQGVKPLTARRAQHALYAWMAGEDLRSQMSRTAWYRLRALLLRVGVDISMPCDIRTLNVRVREIELRPVALSDVPPWYRWAA